MFDTSIIFRIIMLGVALLFFGVTMYLVRNDKGEVRHMKLWLIVSVALLFVAFFPNLLIFVSKLIGFRTFSNFLMFTAIALLLFITLSQHIKIIEHEKQIKTLIQEISIAEKEEK
ncbi:hypothetical protein SAMN02745116_01647 [Pilibacter termitis]|jgi:hypothetical protein|uniref:DUF2304 domain-containing protein n=1 Tax=Pilibacter termitis TaxID=263852 RepID=A0A1T4P454_9ENTE|nr:DUF2304 domain-containing protein [Pilibacter termitis]SJZ86325.1 hypothetical protein SAMN02745116_01647 [Pilibacter termitis]